MRLASGVYYHRNDVNWDGYLKFLTLTLHKDSDNNIQKCFNLLVKEIRYSFGYFEYFGVKVETQHYHTICFAHRMPQEWRKEKWIQITEDSFEVDIRATERPLHNINKLVSYTVDQYVVSQTGLIRFSMSKHWLPAGWKRKWSELISLNDYDYHQALPYWHSWLDGWALVSNEVIKEKALQKRERRM